MCVGPPSFDPFGAFHKCSHKSGFSWPRIDFLTFVAAFFRRFSRFSFLVFLAFPFPFSRLSFTHSLSHFSGLLLVSLFAVGL